MKKHVSLLAVLALAAWANQSLAQISVSVGQPSIHGRIDIGGHPAPDLIFPYAIMGHAGIYSGPPVYMHVPAAHAHRWNHYCSYYNACEVMVYFVQPSWYNTVYAGGGRTYPTYAPTYVPAPIYGLPPYYAPPRPIYRHHGHHFHGGHDHRHGPYHHGHGGHSGHRHRGHDHR